MTADHDDADEGDSDDGDDAPYNLTTGKHLDEPTAKGMMSTTKFSVQDREMTEMAELNERRQEIQADEDEDD